MNYWAEVLVESLERIKEENNLGPLREYMHARGLSLSEQESELLESFAIGDGTSKPETLRRIKNFARAKNRYQDLRHECPDKEERTKIVIKEFPDLLPQHIDLYVVGAA